MDKLKKYSMYIGYIGCFLLLIGVFLPFVSIDIIFFNYSVNYFEGDGILILLLDIIIVALIFFERTKLTFIPIILSVIIFGYDLIESGSELGKYAKFIKFGIGVYIIILGIILCLIYALLYKKKNKDIENYNSNKIEMLVKQSQTLISNTQENVYITFSDEESVPDYKFCVNCGEKLDKDATKCFICGKDI